MRLRLRNRFALFAALAVMMSALGAAHLPITPTYASLPATSRVRDGAGTGAVLPMSTDFHEVASPGFGDPENSWAWSMQWYQNALYVGTNRAWLCLQQAALNKGFPTWFHYPPTDPDFTVPCASAPQSLPLAGEIWRMDPAGAAPGTIFSQANWTRVYQSPYGGPYNGQSIMVPITNTNVLTPAARDIGFRGMSVFDDGALYVSGIGTSPINGATVPPPSLLRTTDGQNFTAVPADPGTTMGDINALTNPGAGCCIRGTTTYDHKFFAVIGDFQGAGRVYVSSNPAAGDNSFQLLTTGTPIGVAAYEIQPFNGHLYIGLQSYLNGYSVVRTDCTTPPCPQSAFTTVVPGGGGLGGGGSFTVTSMHVYTDTNGVPHLYVGTDGAGLVHQPAEVIRINPTASGQPDSWDLVVGKPRMVDGVYKTPLSGLGAGFDWLFNIHMWRMEDYNGVLYIGTFDNSTSYKNIPILGPLLRPLMGFDLWASTDGIHFSPVTLNGFGDPFSAGARSMQATPYGLFVGGASLYKALRVWQCVCSATALQNAPQNVQADPLGGGAVALTWDAPSTARLIHVYRSTQAQVTVPRGMSASPRTGIYPLPPTIAVPGSYTEIGTTTDPYYVDRTAQSGAHYAYYVVAQDASGHLSGLSNVAATPSALPAITFPSIVAIVQYFAAHHVLTSSQATSIDAALQAAQARLRAGDPMGSQAALEALRQAILSNAHGDVARMYAEALAVPLSLLEQRLTLVHAGVLSASQLY